MHKVTRESDEHVCSCGLRWGTDEVDPHCEADPFNPNHFAELELNTDEADPHHKYECGEKIPQGEGNTGANKGCGKFNCGPCNEFMYSC